MASVTQSRVGALASRHGGRRRRLDREARRGRRAQAPQRIEDVAAATAEDLVAIRDIGPKAAEGIVAFFARPEVPYPDPQQPGRRRQDRHEIPGGGIFRPERAYTVGQCPQCDGRRSPIDAGDQRTQIAPLFEMVRVKSAEELRDAPAHWVPVDHRSLDACRIEHRDGILDEA
ncbi:helix-hairpin-helix domain-containing protein [Actinomadura luteofluorescens]|uniref:helix-hairpin-helix domain-containing protein n=1 Tax=Actinomadura luteofluorescens TaxID=46163 RepID=UPI003D9348C3